MVDLSEVAPEDDIFVLECLPQGILPRSLTRSGLREWMDSEIKFWQDFSGFAESLPVQNTRYQFTPMNEAYANFWTSRLAFSEWVEMSRAVSDALEAAETLDLILSEGSIARKLADTNIDPETRSVGGMNYSGFLRAKWLGLPKPVLTEIERAGIILKLHPGASAATNVNEIEDTLRASKERDEESRAYIKQTEKEVEDLKAEITNLENTYHEKLRLEAPAKYWETVAGAARREAGWWLFGFIALVVIGIGAILYFWGAISSSLDVLLKDAPLGGVAIVSLVGLAYGWVLKHFSRGFIQNMQTAADAAHRRVMVMTYLGLAKDPETEIGEKERALILNALFRPAPPHSSDDGPPAGLLELIRSK